MSGLTKPGPKRKRKRPRTKEGKQAESAVYRMIRNGLPRVHGQEKRMPPRKPRETRVSTEKRPPTALPGLAVWCASENCFWATARPVYAVPESCDTCGGPVDMKLEPNREAALREARRHYAPKKERMRYVCGARCGWGHTAEPPYNEFPCPRCGDATELVRYNSGQDSMLDQMAR